MYVRTGAMHMYVHNKFGRKDTTKFWYTQIFLNKSADFFLFVGKTHPFTLKTQRIHLSEPLKTTHFFLAQNHIIYRINLYNSIFIRTFVPNLVHHPKMGSKNNPQNHTFMKEQVLNAMRAAGKPVSAGEVAKSLNADRKEVDKAFADLKKEGAIVSPVRCKWTVA